MLNNRVNNWIEVKACSGGIYKSHPKSRFIKMQMGSTLSSSLLAFNESNEEKYKNVVILQIVNFGDWLIAEIMNKDDYEKENIIINLNNESDNSDNSNQQY